jgi:hypothetical protein
MATVNGWLDGCKFMLEADLMAYLDEDYDVEDTLLGCSVGTNRLDMLRFWLSQRVRFKKPQLILIGCVEDILYDIPESFTLYITEVIPVLLDYLVNLRHGIKLLMEEHGIEYCCDGARNSLPDAHVTCMLHALMREGIEVPQHYWPAGKSLYYRCAARLSVFESLYKAGFCDITQESFECSMETSCSPLLCLVTVGAPTIAWSLTGHSQTVRWFLSRGANLRETWPGSDSTALHCLAWQFAHHLQARHTHSRCGDDPIMEVSWTYEDFEFFVKEEILDGCECGCSSSGCDFLSCFWKGMFADVHPSSQFSSICDFFENATLMRRMERTTAHTDFDRSPEELQSAFLLELTIWIDKAANTLDLCRIIHEYIRLFVFSYLELRHTCCDIKRIQHYYSWNPSDSGNQPCPRYPPKDTRRITHEDAHLRARLDELVPELISQYDTIGGELCDFVIDVLIPTLRKTSRVLKEEDKALYASGRRELGVIMYEEEDEAEQDDSNAEEEEADTESESDY